LASRFGDHGIADQPSRRIELLPHVASASVVGTPPAPGSAAGRQPRWMTGLTLRGLAQPDLE
jgi:hypothetical protein